MSKGKTKRPFLRLIHLIDASHPNGFYPETALDEERIAMDYPVGHIYEAQLKEPRSLPRMRLYWSCMHHVFHNDPYGYASPEKISDAILVAAGVCSPERRLDGTVVMVPDSIAFVNMGEEAFRKFFDQALEIIRIHWKIDIDTLLKEGGRLITRKPYYYGASNGSGKGSREQNRRAEKETA